MHPTLSEAVFQMHQGLAGDMAFAVFAQMSLSTDYLLQVFLDAG